MLETLKAKLLKAAGEHFAQGVAGALVTHGLATQTDATTFVGVLVSVAAYAYRALKEARQHHGG